MKETYIVSAVRTPMGSFGGILSSMTAVQLGTEAVKGALNKAGVNPEQVQEVFMGNVVSANLGQAPAKQVALGAGIPYATPCTLINKVCSSGLKAVMLGSQSIALGVSDIVVAGGMESMSNIPYYADKARWGAKFGNTKLIDGLSKDGLQDAYDLVPMGVAGDQTANEEDITREEQDRYAIQSYHRSAEATEKGYFKDEIIPITIQKRKGDPIVVDNDEEYKKVKFEKIPKLRPVFTKDGSVTAANASTINDGASALILASKEAVEKYNLKPIAKIIGMADAGLEPMHFTSAPTIAAPLAMKRAGISQNEVDFFEVNEAFSVVPLLFNMRLGISEEKVNIHGGAISLGHPLGASGARILTTLVHILNQKSGKYGCAAICNGGGGASSIVVERV